MQMHMSCDLSVDCSVYTELWVAGASMEVGMTKLSRLARLVRKSLPLLIGFVKLLNEVIDLVNKAVNYARQIRELLIFVSKRTEQARFCSKRVRSRVRLKGLVEHATTFEPFYFHLRNGGHVAALHEHRKNRHFARVDLKNFFYSISRNRVARALREIGVPKAWYYAKCSCVKNPFGEPSYSLPYGFVQSPILATLVFSRSVLGEFLRESQREITLSVYMDDIAISSPANDVLQKVFEELKTKIQEANFPINLEKTKPPYGIDGAIQL
jgi:hypothetical protein